MTSAYVPLVHYLKTSSHTQIMHSFGPLRRLYLYSTLLMWILAPAILSVPINIHLRLSTETRHRVEQLSSQMRGVLPNDQIDFSAKFVPHVTLYLTDFQQDKISDIVSAASKVVAEYQPCTLETTVWVVTGDYGMWNINISSCVQKLSDSIVLATSSYITPNQSVPDWVMNLPEPIRDEKIALIKQYGSPNVFGQFQPHITMLWDHDDKNVTAATRFMTGVPPLSWQPPLLGLAQVGPYGTVLKGPEFAIFQLNTGL